MDFIFIMEIYDFWGDLTNESANKITDHYHHYHQYYYHQHQHHHLDFSWFFSLKVLRNVVHY